MFYVLTAIILSVQSSCIMLIDCIWLYARFKLERPVRLVLTIILEMCIPDSILIKLSTLLCEFNLIQEKHDFVNDTSNFLFGSYNVDWAATIIKMFTGKLEKLCISNESHLWYLTARGASTLSEVSPYRVIFFNLNVQRLPSLGKRVWFEASCSHVIPECTRNNHSILGFRKSIVNSISHLILQAVGISWKSNIEISSLIIMLRSNFKDFYSINM